MPEELRAPHGVGVGGWVVRSDGRVLLVRMTYGPAEGRLMIPGGHAEAGEFIDQTAVREVREETGVEAVPHGIVMVRQRPSAEFRNLYLVFLMRAVGEQAMPDGCEVCETIWLSANEMLARNDLQPIAAELAAAWRDSPTLCLTRRPLAWQSDADYRLWAGPPATLAEGE